MRSLGLLAAALVFIGSATAQRTTPDHGQAPANGAANASHSAVSLPKPFAAALPEVKAKSKIPVLLPSEISKAIAGARYTVVEKAHEGEYAVSLYFKLGIGNAGVAAMFSAQAHPGYEPQDLPNVRKVRLSDRIVGYFRPVSCRGSCAPANVWWEENRVLYEVQVVLSRTAPENDQQKAITAIAASAILAGPR